MTTETIYSDAELHWKGTLMKSSTETTLARSVSNMDTATAARSKIGPIALSDVLPQLAHTVRASVSQFLADHHVTNVDDLRGLVLRSDWPVGEGGPARKTLMAVASLSRVCADVPIGRSRSAHSGTKIVYVVYMQMHLMIVSSARDMARHDY